MRGAEGQDTARGDLRILAACTALALLAMALPQRWSYAVASAIRGTVLRPVVALNARAAQDRTARFTLAELQRGNDSLAVLVQQQYALRSENDQLRALAGLRARFHNHTVAADVLHRPTVTDTRMLLLDIGTDNGVQQFDPVVTAAGVIGYIANCGAHASSVLTWASPDFAVSAVTVDGRVSGFIQPSAELERAGPVLELHGVAFRDSLRVGTVVMTAGMGRTFPRGIPIGRIVSVGTEEMGYDRVYRVIPFANPAYVSHVVVLVQPRDSMFPAPAAAPPAVPAPVVH